MAICSFLMKIIPLDCAIAIACYIILSKLGLPFKASARIFTLSRSITDAHDFSLINVVNSDLSVWACCSNVFIISTDFEWENLSVNITKKVHQTGLVWFILFVVEFEDSRTEVFLFGIMCSVLEKMIPFF